MADPKQEESFRVVDRRLFNADGQIRDEAVREERRHEETRPLPATPTLQSNKAGAAPPAPSASEQILGGAQPAAAPPAAEAPKSLRGLEMLINFIAQNAAMLLGAYPDPRTGQPILDLEGARELIDMLDALHESTRGNLAPDDQRLLLDVLGSLKLSFMEMTKAAAKAMQETAQARP